MRPFRSLMKNDTRRIIAGSVIAAAVVWTIDAVFDVVVSQQRTFTDLLAGDVPLHDLVFRVLFAVVVIAGAYRYAKVREKRMLSRDELQRHLAAVDASMDGVAIFNDRHEYLYVNNAYARITGYRSPQEMVGKTFRLIYDDCHISWIERNIFPVLEKEGRWRGELGARKKDGTIFEQEASITRLPDNSCVCVMRDVTERNRREEALRRSELLLDSIFASIHDPFCIFDENYRIVKVNQAYAELKEKAIDILVERTCFEAMANRSTVCDDCLIQKTFQSGDPCAKEKKIILRTGETLWLEIYTYPIKDAQGKTVQVIEYTRDVTDRKRSEEDRKRLIGRLEHLSSVDGLTGLLNRRALTEQLSYEIERARRFGAPLAIMLCDMDNLKMINDKHGHAAGDMAIQLVSAALRNAIRSVDIAGRYGGDEFLVILPETPIEGAQSLAEKLRHVIQHSEIRLEGNRNAALSLSTGIGVLADPPEDGDGFIKRIDSALYNSKHAGRNRITVAK